MIRNNGGITVIVSAVDRCGPHSSCDCVVRMILLVKCMTFLFSLQVNPKSPDFKHKVGGHALWLTDAPSWVLSELGVEVDVKTQKSRQVKQHRCERGNFWLGRKTKKKSLV